MSRMVPFPGDHGDLSWSLGRLLRALVGARGHETTLSLKSHPVKSMQQEGRDPVWSPLAL